MTTPWSSYHLRLVEPYDPPFRFLINSLTGYGIYTVDLLSYNGNGWCDCPRFRMELEPKLARGAPRGDALRCKHILLARVFMCLEYVVDNVVDECIAKDKKRNRAKDSDSELV